MFATKDNERLYLASWEYNALLILDKLNKIVEKAGGRVKPGKTAIISNRSITCARHVYETRIGTLAKRYVGRGINDDTNKEIEGLKLKLATLSEIDDTPIECFGQTWTRFVINNDVYYFSLDDNPFFEFHYSKTPLKSDGTYSLDACCGVAGRSWLRDIHLGYECTVADRQLAAQSIFDMLIKAKNTQIMRNERRIRVANTYDGGYHMETVCGKERTAKLDF